jgi:transposase
MIRIEFTEEDIKALHYWRFHHPHPRVQLKMEALLLKSQGLPHKQICRMLQITENTLRRYLRDYLAGGIEKLKELNFFKPESELAAHRQTLEAYFHEHPPATVKEAAAKIEELTGIRRGLSQVREFLKSIGMRRLKVGFMPAKADIDEQERFKKRQTPAAAGRGRGRPPRRVLR